WCPAGVLHRKSWQNAPAKSGPDELLDGLDAAELHQRLLSHAAVREPPVNDAPRMATCLVEKQWPFDQGVRRQPSRGSTLIGWEDRDEFVAIDLRHLQGAAGGGHRYHREIEDVVFHALQYLGRVAGLHRDLQAWHAI